MQLFFGKRCSGTIAPSVETDQTIPVPRQRRKACGIQFRPRSDEKRETRRTHQPIIKMDMLTVSRFRESIRKEARVCGRGRSGRRHSFSTPVTITPAARKSCACFFSETADGRCDPPPIVCRLRYGLAPHLTAHLVAHTQRERPARPRS